MPHPRRTGSRRKGAPGTEEEEGPGSRHESSHPSDPPPIQSNPLIPPPPDHLQFHSERLTDRHPLQEEDRRHSLPTPGGSSPSAGNPALQVYPSLSEIPPSRLRTRIHPAPSPLSLTSTREHSIPPPGPTQRGGQRGPRGPRTSRRARVMVPLPSRPSIGPPHGGTDADPSEYRRTPFARSMDVTRTDRSAEHRVDERFEDAHDTAGPSGTHGGSRSTPRSRYTTDPVETPVHSDLFRTYRLQILQHPIRGRALDREPWRTASPPLSPPCVLRLMVRDRSDQLVDVDDTVSLRRIHFMIASVNLFSEDGKKDLSVVHFRSEQHSHWGQKKDGLLPGAVDQGLLGERTKTSQIFEIGPEGAREKAHLFIFPDLVVRPIGRFSLRFVLSDIGNPSQFTTSTTTSKILDTVFSPPFDTTESWIGPVRMTALTRSLKEQKARGIKGGSEPVGAVGAVEGPDGDEDVGDDGNESSNSSSEGGGP